MLIDFIGIPIQHSVAFYTKALKPLGITALPDYEGKNGHPDLKGFGVGKRHFFWLRVYQSILDSWLSRNCQVGGARKDLRPRP